MASRHDSRGRSRCQSVLGGERRMVRGGPDRSWATCARAPADLAASADRELPAIESPTAPTSTICCRRGGGARPREQAPFGRTRRTRRPRARLPGRDGAALHAAALAARDPARERSSRSEPRKLALGIRSRQPGANPRRPPPRRRRRSEPALRSSTGPPTSSRARRHPLCRPGDPRASTPRRASRARRPSVQRDHRVASLSDREHEVAPSSGPADQSRDRRTPGSQ